MGFQVWLDSRGLPPRSFWRRTGILLNGNFVLHLSIGGILDKLDRVDEGQAHLIQAFESGAGRDKNRCNMARDLGIKSVGSL